MTTSRSRVALMGATGSIGTQTIDVLRREPDRFELVALSSGRRVRELAELVKEFGVRRVAVAGEEQRRELAALVPAHVAIEVGEEGLRELCRDVDVVVNAVMGFAGLPVTLATLEAGARLALANKESLIAAAPVVAQARRTPGAQILPVDSEHCAIHQCLQGSLETGHPDVARLLLTASGGPFRGWTSEQLARVTTGDALAHPTWNMGPKITIDSSTLMNKGLEVLEASALFGIEVDRIDVVVHPQSVVHSMVEYVDGSVLAQLSRPDMRLPIAYCLGAPERLAHHWGQLDFSTSLHLDFEPPDRAAFPALDLAYAAARRGGAAPAWLSAANEVCVEAFLAQRIGWSDIATVVARTMDRYVDDPLVDLQAVIENDAAARRIAHANLPE
ncbi:MAG: 1-deoxy-D-xylulose-5-phosphate reductoisomerase [Acidobacteriota bacterium]|nr:1-deoxy-D-xylulose-5-phosphate reductoisomerase [Acidobacteriota bacterium]